MEKSYATSAKTHISQFTGTEHNSYEKMTLLNKRFNRPHDNFAKLIAHSIKTC